MSDPRRVPGAGAGAAGAPGVTRLLDLAARLAGEARRTDLVEALDAARRRLDDGACTVLVVGEFGQGKSALVNALLGLPVCGTDPVAATAVTTVVRHGAEPAAWLVPAGPQGSRIPVPPVDAARAALTGLGPGGEPLAAVEIAVPRELLRAGLVLVDTPGVGGGFAAARTAVTLRAMATADALVFTSDASHELTASEVDFLRRALEVCPVAICAVTKTDLYPHWRRIVDLDREHLRRAGLAVDVVPLAAPLRELAVDTGDPALAAESGYPVLTDLLLGRLRGRRRDAARHAAARTALGVLRQLEGQLATEQETLVDPAGHAGRLAALEELQERALRMQTGAARWQHVLADGLRRASRGAVDDLQARLERVSRDVSERIDEIDPTRDWPDFEPWLFERVNTELLAHQQHAVELSRQLIAEVAAEFDLGLADLPAARWLADRPSSSPQAAAMDAPALRTGSVIDSSMNAARGFSLGGSMGSVLATVLLAAGHPAAFITLPVFAGVGVAFAVRSLRGGREAVLRQTRAEAVRHVAVYLERTRTSTWHADEDALDGVRRALRDHFVEAAAQLVVAARANLETAASAAAVAQDGATGRLAVVRHRREVLGRLVGTVSAAVDAQGGAA